MMTSTVGMGFRNDFLWATTSFYRISRQPRNGGQVSSCGDVSNPFFAIFLKGRIGMDFALFIMDIAGRSRTMTRKGKTAILVLSLAVLGSSLRAQGNYKVANGPEDMYFGHVSLVDVKNDGMDALVFRVGREQPEVAVLNMPLGPGDTLRTSGQRRLEVQFDNATIMRLDFETELKIETILAESLSSKDSKVTNFVLNKGRLYVMYKEYNAKEIFQVLTPNAAIKFKHATIASLTLEGNGNTNVQVEYGKCFVLAGPDANRLEEEEIAKGKSAAISTNGAIKLGLSNPEAEFDAYNKSINKNYEELHQGLTPLPKAIQRLPKAVFYFAQTYGNPNGEWLYDDYYGYVWRPFYNDAYPSGVWQPYLYGHWTSFDGQLYWVPDEPWGWVPYHLGVWQWDEKKGWLWIPGSAFAPAWVDWAFFYGNSFSWRPWSMWDWYRFLGTNFEYFYMGNYFAGTYDDFFMGNYFAWRNYGIKAGDLENLWGQGDNIFGANSQNRLNTVKTVVTKDQLKKPAAPPFAMPKEFAKIMKALDKGLSNNDTRLVNSLRAIGQQAVVVQGRDLGAPQISERAVKLEAYLQKIRPQLPTEPAQAAALLRPQSLQNSAFNAIRAFRPSANAASAGRASLSGQNLSGQRATPLSAPPRVSSALNGMIAPAISRISDWNPDVRAAQLLRASIQYSSGTNQIYSPELRISSLNAASIDNPLRPGNLTDRSSRNGASDLSGGYGSSGGRSDASSGSSNAAASAGSSGSSSGSSSGGGHIRH
jgi:hypothetical protein